MFMQYFSSVLRLTVFNMHVPWVVTVMPFHISRLHSCFIVERYLDGTSDNGKVFTVASESTWKKRGFPSIIISQWIAWVWYSATPLTYSTDVMSSPSKISSTESSVSPWTGLCDVHISEPGKWVFLYFQHTLPYAGHSSFKGWLDAQNLHLVWAVPGVLGGSFLFLLKGLPCFGCFWVTTLSIWPVPTIARTCDWVDSYALQVSIQVFRSNSYIPRWLIIYSCILLSLGPKRSPEYNCKNHTFWPLCVEHWPTV